MINNMDKECAAHGRTAHLYTGGAVNLLDANVGGRGVTDITHTHGRVRGSVAAVMNTPIQQTFTVVGCLRVVGCCGLLVLGCGLG